MKKLLLFLAIGYVTSAQAQWNTVAQQNGVLFHAINEDSLLVITNGSTIHQSFNAGASWSTLKSNTFKNTAVYDLHFPSAQVGYIIGGSNSAENKQTMLKTTNGGITWDSIMADAWGGRYPLNNVWFVTEEIGYVTVDATGIWKTMDGGRTYDVITITPEIHLHDLCFTNSQNGFVATSHQISNDVTEYQILNTKNGGASWRVMYADTIHNATTLHHRKLNKIVFINDNVGYAVGGNGLLLKTINGGDTWQKSFVAPYLDIIAVDFISEQQGYIANAYGIYFTQDGGQSWVKQTMYPNNPISFIQMIDEQVGYAYNGVQIYKSINGGNSSTAIINPILKSAIKIFPNPTTNHIQIEIAPSLTFKSLEIVDVYGRILATYSNLKSTISLASFPTGSYLVNVVTEEGTTTQTIIKQ